MSLFRSRYALILSVILLLQAGVFYGVAQREEMVPNVAPLDTFPESFGGYSLIKSSIIDDATRELLSADDLLSRQYEDANRRQVGLFIAYFKTQRYGQSPHSPKNCLPGSGWEPLTTDRPAISISGRDAPIVVNRYVVEKGDEKSVTLYWYQAHSRVIASEFSAKFWLVADSLRYRRSDTSLVRVSVPVYQGDVESATQSAYRFVQAAFPLIRHQLPL